MSSPLPLPHNLIRSLQALADVECALIASDFDGVLAPFADDPSAARPLDGAIAALADLASVGVPVALVSGRHLDSLRAVSGVRPDHHIDLIGSHGAESTRPLDLGGTMDHAAVDRLRRTTGALERVVSQHAGTRLEHKPTGVALHTRGLPGDVAESAAVAALAAARHLAGVHAMRGKDVVEIGVLPVSKGKALTALAAEVGAQAVVYLGDDVTDETAFEVLPASAGHVTVKVGPGGTAATHRVAGPPEALAVLRTLVGLLLPSRST